jgi:hypothetical protein
MYKLRCPIDKNEGVVKANLSWGGFYKRGYQEKTLHPFRREGLFLLPSSPAGSSDIANPGRKPVEYITFFAPDSSILYQLKGPQLKPGEDTLVDVAQLREQRIPDPQRRIMPATVKEGTFEVEVPDASGGMLFAAAATPAASPDAMPDSIFTLCCGRVDPVLAPDPWNAHIADAGWEVPSVRNTCTDAYVSPPEAWFDDYIGTVISLEPSGMRAFVTALAPGNALMSATVATYLGGLRCGELYYQNVQADANVFAFSVHGNPYIFVGSDDHLLLANLYYADNGNGGPPQPPGGSFSGTSNDSGDVFTSASLPLFPALKVKTADQSTNSGDRSLTFKYELSGNSIVQVLTVTARKFHAVTNSGLTNSCSYYGATYLLTYKVWTLPDHAQVTESNLDGTPTDETFDISPGVPCAGVTHQNGGSLNSNSEFGDTLSLCSNAPIPSCSQEWTQHISVAGFEVRQNTLYWNSSTGVTYTTLGPNP